VARRCRHVAEPPGSGTRAAHGTPNVPNIECMVANCDVVVIGKLVEVRGGEWADVATTAVEETVKDEHRERFDVRFAGFVDLAKWYASRRLLRAADKSASTSRQADAEADRAMSLLKQAVAAGYKDATRIKQ
jgi:hypothetical protein